MVLRGWEAFEDWAQRIDPPHSVWLAVKEWIERLGDAPWQAPSVPIPDVSDQPTSEFRSAVVPGSGGVEVYYRQVYAYDLVELIGVISSGDQPPAA